MQADYLDLDIKVGVDGFFSVDLFDKRDAFPFKVINYPCMAYSNIPSLPSYGVYLSQLIRVARICTEYVGFNNFTTKLTQDFMNKSFDNKLLKKYFKKFVDIYETEWSKLGVVPELPTILI